MPPIIRSLFQGAVGSRKPKPGDVNLPDEKKGKVVGTMTPSQMKTRKKYGMSNEGLKGDKIIGGGISDPRWKTYNKEMKRAR